MTTVNGLPAHVLLVHAIVVLLPLAALLLVLTALWPAARRRLALFNAVLSVVVLILVPITTDAGEWLERRVRSSQLVHTHTELGDTAIWVAIPITVLALVVWWRGREAATLSRAQVAGAEGRSAGAPSAGPGGATTTASTATATATAPTGRKAPHRTFLAPASTAVTVVVAVLCVVAAGAACYDIVRIGDSGAQAGWQGKFSPTPYPRTGGPDQPGEGS